LDGETRSTTRAGAPPTPKAVDYARGRPTHPEEHPTLEDRRRHTTPNGTDRRRAQEPGVPGP
ncbi:MAG: hypothetical protein OSB43_12585, partial [Nocardioides sp.]|uniref:hypothetical protein n=1 Tax=Nocardioides sp. TaxID=35761 RepID=UPI00239785B8